MKRCENCNGIGGAGDDLCPECEGSGASPCSLMPVQLGGREIMLDVSPMTVEEFKEGAIQMLQAHIEWGEQVFPFITANAKDNRS